MPTLDDDVWELYGPDDWTQAHDLSSEEPQKLHELQRLFLIEAVKRNVLPLDDRRIERFDPALAGRPQLIAGNSQMLFPGMGRLTENCVVNTKNKSHAVTAEVIVPDGPADGVIVAQGRAFGGWSLYLLEGRPTYCYNLLGLTRTKVSAQTAVAPGEHQVRMEISLYVDGTKVGDGRIGASVPPIFSADETTDVGSDTASPVSDDYEPRESVFTGRVRWVRIDLGEDAQSAEQLITPEDRLRLAMARQ